MPSCTALVNAILGRAVIVSSGKRYLWTLDEGLRSSADENLVDWLRGKGALLMVPPIMNLVFEDEHPFDKVTIPRLTLEARVGRVLFDAYPIIGPETSKEDRAMMVARCEEALKDDRVFLRAKATLARQPAAMGTDITLSPKEGRLGEIYEIIRMRFGTETFPSAETVLQSVSGRPGRTSARNPGMDFMAEAIYPKAPPKNQMH